MGIGQELVPLAFWCKMEFVPFTSFFELEVINILTYVCEPVCLLALGPTNVRRRPAFMS